MNKKIALGAAFIVPLLITLIVCIDHEIYPFGEQCMLQVDMYHQYCPFFTELMDKLKSGGSLFYSWNIGLGVDFVSLYAYYLASPLNLFLVFCPAEYVVEFMTILVVLKTALSGLTFAYYLICHFKLTEPRALDGKRMQPAVGMFGAAIFGSAYALSAFMAAYAWNIMWTDCMVLAPLVILGLERLVKEGRPLLYYSMLSLCILSNYYISIMVCVFLVLWFLLYWFENRDTGWMPWVRFAGYSLLAGGTGAVLIIPTAIILGYSGNQGISFPETIEWYFNIIAELARHLVMVDAYTTGGEHWANVYCGVFVLVFFVLYLLNRKIAWQGKLSRCLLLVFFMVSFANNVLDFIWHGLHFPTSLPGRQSFLYIFVLLVVAFEAFLWLRESRVWHVLLAGAVCAGFLTLVYLFVDEETFDTGVFVVSGIFLGCYLVLAVCYVAGAKRWRQAMLAVGCFVVVAELTLNYDITGLDTVSRSAYIGAMEDYRSVITKAKVWANEKDVSFYRTEELERKTKNDAALFGYRSATQFSSLMNLNVSHFYQNVGMEGGKNFYCISGSTPLLEAMLSVRYLIADNPMEESPMRTLVAKTGDVYLYENKYVLPLGFMVGEDVIDAWNYDDAGDIASQNELARLLGADDLMLEPTEIQVTSMAGESSFLVERDGIYYATYEKTSVNNLKQENSDGRTRSFTKVSHGYTLELGYCEAGTGVKISNSDNEVVQFTVYRLNTDAVQAAYDTLNSQTLKLDDTKSDSCIGGTIEVSEAGRLVFSIASEDGWTLYVDGEETEAENFSGAFLSVHLEPGTHEIELRYVTPGFWLGAGISGICVAIFALCMWIQAWRARKQNEK